MLQPEYLEHIPDELNRLYLSAENEILIGIAKRLKLRGYLTSSSLYKLLRLSELKRFEIDYKEILAELSDKSIKEIDRIFREASEETYNYDKKLFEAKAINWIPYEENLILQNIVQLEAMQTREIFKNITNSSALNMVNPVTGNVEPLPKIYIDILDSASNKTLTGLQTYDEVIREAINSMANNGILVANYESGRNEKIEGVVRRNVLTSINNMASKVSEMNAKELGAEHYEVSAHIGARTRNKTQPLYADHSSWQGRIYKINGTDDKYKNFYETTGYGEIEGLCGVNCKHSFSAFLVGVSTPVYTEEELADLNRKDKETKSYIFKNRQGEEYEKQMTLYDQQQYMRHCERTMRTTRRKSVMFQNVGDDEKATLLKGRYQSQRRQYNEFCKAMGLTPEYNSRVYMDGLGRI